MRLGGGGADSEDTHDNTQTQSGEKFWSQREMRGDKSVGGISRRVFD